MSHHHARAFWAVLLRVSKLNSRLNWLAGASILPDRLCAHVTSMASTGNKFVITPLHGKYPIYKPLGSVLVNRIYPSQGVITYTCILQECHILWSMNIKGACEYRTAMDKTEKEIEHFNVTAPSPSNIPCDGDG